jgi:hypothetical protein
LLKGYVKDQPQSYVRTWDFKQFVAFLKDGGPEPKNLKAGIRQATHDAQVSDALRKYLEQNGPKAEKPKLVGIMADGVPGVSLAIPTWVYGSEPTTPFASAYAKYFQNSIREETLITEGRTGVLYAKGGGGTLREIFQDVELNFYVRNAEAFTPMIFVDPDLFWEKDAVYDANDNVVTPGIKLDTTIASIFKMALPPKIRVDCKRKIQFTTDPETIRGVLEGHAPAAQKKLEMMLEGGAAALLTANGTDEE